MPELCKCGHPRGYHVINYSCSGKPCACVGFTPLDAQADYPVAPGSDAWLQRRLEIAHELQRSQDRKIA